MYARQHSWDIWAIVLAVWLLAIIERGRIRSGDWPEVNVFTLIFESESEALDVLDNMALNQFARSPGVSAYGTVGLSLGNGRVRTLPARIKLLTVPDNSCHISRFAEQRFTLGCLVNPLETRLDCTHDSRSSSWSTHREFVRNPPLSSCRVVCT